jgi:hypothetical protein
MAHQARTAGVRITGDNSNRGASLARTRRITGALRASITARLPRGITRISMRINGASILRGIDRCGKRDRGAHPRAHHARTMRTWRIAGASAHRTRPVARNWRVSAGITHHCIVCDYGELLKRS